MMTTWVLVADSKKAKIFTSVDKYGELTELNDFIHPVVHSGGENPNSRAVAGRSGTRHGMERASPKEHDANVFAAELIGFLDKEFSKRRFSELTLAAPPEFLGVLRGALHGELKKSVNHSIDKDLTHCSPAQLTQLLHDQWSIH